MDSRFERAECRTDNFALVNDRDDEGYSEAEHHRERVVRHK